MKIQHDSSELYTVVLSNRSVANLARNFIDDENFRDSDILTFHFDDSLKTEILPASWPITFAGDVSRTSKVSKNRLAESSSFVLSKHG